MGSAGMTTMERLAALSKSEQKRYQALRRTMKVKAALDVIERERKKVEMDLHGAINRFRSLTEAKKKGLWSLRWSAAWGWKWNHERDVQDDTADQWLAQFKKDEPEVYFVISQGKPRKNPKTVASKMGLKQL